MLGAVVILEATVGGIVRRVASGPRSIVLTPALALPGKARAIVAAAHHSVTAESGGQIRQRPYRRISPQ